jgi:ADP-ribose pyrophosphatase
MKPYLTIHSDSIHSGYFKARIDQIQRPNGASGTYSVLEIGPAIVILAQDRQGRYVFNREYRHPAGEFLLGLPGGKLEKGEDPLEGAKRELLEETGYLSSDWLLLGKAYPLPAVADQQIFFYQALQATPTAARHLDPLEVIEPALYTAGDLKGHIEQGLPVDGILLTAFSFQNFLR